MPLIRPFAGLRPAPEFADKVVAPPKSTWFEPKLADGIISHILD